jgi:outer membrane receptor protein involved in Fe transport
MKKSLLLGIFSLLCACLWSQQIPITGKIKNKTTDETISSASIVVKGSSSGTYTNNNGDFILHVPALPVTLLISSIGFEAQELTISSKETVAIALNPVIAMGEEIVVSATRVPTKILESPVSIERLGLNAIRNTPATSYYDAAAYLKGVDLTTSSFTFKTISTRGFNGSGSTRVNQLVDGMDNQAPGLNFFLGSFLGLTELDVENVEILPGASSALYGPGGINGTILITSKNPFKYQGLSIQLKEGITNIDKSRRDKVTPFHDFSFRWAKAFNNKFAFKIGGQYISATDWLASDSSNYSRAGVIGKGIPGTRQSDPNYDGVNVYGDETTVDLKKFIPPSIAGLPATIPVSRTGYAEKDVIDPKTKDIKLSAALHYKLNEKFEAQLMGYWATGSTIYTGNNRYVLKDIKLGQYKLELKHTDWLIRSYTTQENAGEAYSATVTPIIFNEAWKRSFDPNNINGSWYPQYTGAFLQAMQGGASYDQAHIIARQFADQGRPQPGSAAFKQIFDQVRKIPIPKGGLFQEKSQLWMTEGQYNFSKWIKFVDLIAGVNWKNYILNSKGTIFIDTAGPIHIKETGAYAQATKKLFNNSLTLSFSGRYDKNEDFKGRFTPRATALVRIAKDNNLRFSYQTAYRFPSTQQKYIRLDVGDYTILGGLPWVERYLDAAKSNIFEIKNGTPDLSKAYVFSELKPESVQSFEVGYKGVLAKKLLLDAYGYWGRYENFLGRNALYHAQRQEVYSTVVNSSTRVKTYGFGLGADYLLPKNYSVFFNGYSDVLTDVPSGFQSYFNTPKYRFNAGIANSGLGKKKVIGFNASFHWQDAFNWDGDLANGPVNAFTTIDAQVTYKLPAIHSMVRLGATNLINHYYKNAFANPEVGGVYYLSFGYNIL